MATPVESAGRAAFWPARDLDLERVDGSLAQIHEKSCQFVGTILRDRPYRVRKIRRRCRRPPLGHDYDYREAPRSRP